MPRRQENVVEESVKQEIVIEGRLVAHRTQPLGFLLVHLQIQVGVETLKMIAGRSSTRKRHAHFALNKRN